jgi:uroporphyrinogen decarboxylase
VNSRERVLATIRNQKTDRVPYDFWAENATLEKIYHTFGHRDIDRILKEFNVDIRHIEAKMPQEENHGNFFQNFWGERYIYKQTEWGPVREDLPGALHDISRFAEIKRFHWPNPDLFDYSDLKNLCDRNKEFAIMYGFADIWQRPSLVRGMENALRDLLLNPDWVHFLSRKFTDFYKEDYFRAYKASGKKIDIFLIISDLGGQNGPMISLDMFDDFIAPYIKELTDHIHDLGAYVMFHSCGMIFPFLERFIEIGIDIIDPIQPIDKKMSPENLAETFGGRICFHGGIDIQNVLPFGTPDDVKREVNKYADILGKNGGYICCPAHLFQPDIPVENIAAFYEALT